MRPSVTLGPPIDDFVDTRDELRVAYHRRFLDKDPELLAVHSRWEQAPRKAVRELPPVAFEPPGEAT